MNRLTTKTTRRASPATRAHRLGLTLTELLAVIVVLMILASMTVGALRPTMQGAQIRQASEVLRSTLTTARYRAQRSGRAAGLMFELLPNGSASMTLVPVEEPPPFGGLSTGATVTLELATHPDSPSEPVTEMSVKTTFSEDRTLSQLQSVGLVAAGDRVQFDYRGPKYVILGIGNDNSMVIYSASQGGPNPPLDRPVPFVFFRRPRPSTMPAVTLPDGAVVDLTLSGGGESGTLGLNEAFPVMVMFSPAGHVDRVFSADGNSGVIEYRPSYPFSFLVGRIDQIGSRNLGDLESRWISVNSQTGMVATFEMASVGTTTPTVNVENLTRGRKFIRTSRGEGAGQAIGE